MVSSDRALINGDQDCFKVLIVDSNPASLHNLEQLLNRCTYQVFKCGTAAEALSTLQEEKNKLDIVICDRQLSDMNGLNLLRQISEIDNRLPVIMVSADESKEASWESMTAGACDHLVKPIKMEAINDLWKHGLRKKVECLKDLQLHRSDHDINQYICNNNNSNNNHNYDDIHHDHNPMPSTTTTTTTENNNVMINGNCKKKKKKKYTEVLDLHGTGDHNNNDSSGSDHDQPAPHGGANKKQRLIWTPDLHGNFIAAVNQLGGDKAVPKKILECMHGRGFTEITRENVASHLQKYRLHLQKQPNPSQKVDGNCMESKKFSIFEQAASSPLMPSSNNNSSTLATFPQPSSMQYSYPCSTASPFLAPAPAPAPATGGRLMERSSSVGLPLAVDHHHHHHQGNFLFDPKSTPEPSYIFYNSINNNLALRNAIHGSVSTLPYKSESCCAPTPICMTDQDQYMLYSSMGNLAVHDQQGRPLPIDDEMAYEPAFVFRQYHQAQDHDIFPRIP